MVEDFSVTRVGKIFLLRVPVTVGKVIIGSEPQLTK